MPANTQPAWRIRSEAERQFIDAMGSRNLKLCSGEHLIGDGQIHRCDVNKPHGEKDGTYVVHLDDPVPWGMICNWTDGRGPQGWRYKGNYKLTEAERHELDRKAAAAKEAMAAARERQYQEAAQLAQQMWEASPPARDRHPYLVRKGVRSYGLRQDGYLLLVPMWDRDGKLQSLLTIGRDGRKLNFKGGRAAEGYFCIEKDAADDGTTICIAEGYATAASIYEATGHCVFVAFTCSNLTAVAKMVSERYPDARIVLCADDDCTKPDNPGIGDARKAALEIGGVVAIPESSEASSDADLDFNDLAKMAGSETVKQIIDAATECEPDLTESEEASASANQREEKQADRLISIATSEALVFHSPDGVGYADVTVERHQETWPLRSRGFSQWLGRRYYEQTKSAPNSQSLSSALNVIEAQARFSGPTYEVYLRIAQVEGKIYLDLCDSEWRVVEINKNGWRVLGGRDCPVRFMRRGGMQPLPVPLKGGSVDALQQYVNSSKADFILLVAYLLVALRGCGPYPVLVLLGEAGAAKSTLLKVVKRLVDPNKADLRAPPRENRDVFITANNSHVITLDNLSHLPEWLSDTLCRLATGGGFATRELYTDEGEKIFDATRPVALTAIENVAVRGDLADRAIFLTLEAIPDDRRQPEDEFWAAFEADRPYILGALLDVVSHGLGALPRTKVEDLPRMADFAKWSTACEGALWQPGTFGRVYYLNRAKATADIIDADLIARVVETFIEEEGGAWEGESAPLLELLSKHVDEDTKRDKHWPKAPNKLSGKLTRAASPLRRMGIDIRAKNDPKTRRRVWSIKKVRNPSLVSCDPAKNSDYKHLASQDLAAKHPAFGAKDPDPASLGTNPLINKKIEGSQDTQDVLHANIIEELKPTSTTRRPFQYHFNNPARLNYARQAWLNKQRSR